MLKKITEERKEGVIKRKHGTEKSQRKEGRCYKEKTIKRKVKERKEGRCYKEKTRKRNKSKEGRKEGVIKRKQGKEKSQRKEGRKVL